MWKDLPMRQRADLMHTYLKYGITSLNEMRNHYDSTISSQENKAVTKNMSAYGGNIYDGTSERSQKMNRPNIFKYDDGRYVYQAAPNAEEIDVTPINTLMPDASQWTYQDAEGKIYTPNTQVSTGTLTEVEDTNPLMRAANNYVRELSWRAQNDPSSIALQGKYTMPIVLSPLLAKAGEAAYAAGLTPYIEAGLTSAFAAHGLNHWMNDGIDSGWDAAMTAMEIAPLGGLAKPMWNATKEGLKYTAKAADNAVRYMSPSYDLYRTIGETTPKIGNRFISTNGEGTYNLFDQFGLPIGEATTTAGSREGTKGILWVGSKNNAHKVTEDIYNTIIGDTKDALGEGLESGWELFSPSKTLATTSKFPHSVIGQSSGHDVRLLTGQTSRNIPQRISGNHWYEIKPQIETKLKYNPLTGDFEEVLVNNEMSINNSPTIEWADAARTPQITAENAANRTQEIQNLVPRYNKFAEYYGYDTVPEGVSAQEAENLIKEGLKQHNTFYRGLTYPEGEKLEAVKKVLGENASREEVMDYLAKAGSRDPNNTYFSLDERANQYARTGDVARYTRKYTLGDNPATWLEDADFAFDTTPATSFAPRGSVNYPWAGSYIKEAPGEVRINPEDVIFEGWMPKTTWEYGEYVKPSEYRANRNLYFNENAGGKKPSFPFLLKNR